MIGRSTFIWRLRISGGLLGHTGVSSTTSIEFAQWFYFGKCFPSVVTYGAESGMSHRLGCHYQVLLFDLAEKHTTELILHMILVLLFHPSPQASVSSAIVYSISETYIYGLRLLFRRKIPAWCNF
jgi:hypothetical protein